MGKKISTKKVQRKSHVKGKPKTLGHYIRVYVLSLFSGFIVFLGGTYLFKPSLPCANSATCTSDLSQRIENGAMGIFEGKQIPVPVINPADDLQHAVLGTSVSSGEKHIYVDLASQTLYAYEGSNQIMKTLVSTGRWNKTPVGNFHIWEKLVSTRMAGGEGADAYDLPNVPYVMYFYNDFGLHGAYWHDNFGHTMSHGCVNMRQVDAKALYDWADAPANGQQGTAVSICDNFVAPSTCVQNNPIN